MDIVYDGNNGTILCFVGKYVYFKLKIQIDLFMFHIQFLHLLKYIYIFDNGYKGDPQKTLLKAASMRATILEPQNTHNCIIIETHFIKIASNCSLFDIS